MTDIYMNERWGGRIIFKRSILRPMSRKVNNGDLNCDSEHSFFMTKDRIRFFCVSGEKLRFSWPCSSHEIVVSWILSRKNFFFHFINYIKYRLKTYLQGGCQLFGKLNCLKLLGQVVITEKISPIPFCLPE